MAYGTSCPYCGTTGLRAPYAMSGTDAAYGATRTAGKVKRQNLEAAEMFLMMRTLRELRVPSL
eukprot:3931710-Rhodomonas_salina.1